MSWKNFMEKQFDFSETSIKLPDDKYLIYLIEEEVLDPLV